MIFYSRQQYQWQKQHAANPKAYADYMQPNADVIPCAHKGKNKLNPYYLLMILIFELYGNAEEKILIIRKGGAGRNYITFIRAI